MKNNKYIIIDNYKTLELLKFDKPIFGGIYAIRCTKAKKAKTGLTLDAANEIFYKCIVNR